jgi:PilZ domain
MNDSLGIGSRRRDRRIAVALPVELEAGTGVTRDVSATGVYFDTAVEFALGATIRFALVMEHVDPQGPLRLRCEGRVVRVERRGAERVGLGVAIASHWLEPANGHGTG